RESLVRLGVAVEREPVSVEAPGQRGIPLEPPRLCEFLEAEPQLAVGRIGPPEPLRPPKVRQPRIHPHPRARRDEDPPRARDGLDRLLEFVHAGHHMPFDTHRESTRSSASTMASKLRWTSRGIPNPPAASSRENPCIALRRARAASTRSSPSIPYPRRTAKTTSSASSKAASRCEARGSSTRTARTVAA